MSSSCEKAIIPANTYTGQTNITEGILRAEDNHAFGNSNEVVVSGLGDVARDTEADGPDVDRVFNIFRQSGFSFQEMMIALVKTDVFRGVRTIEKESQ